MSTDVTGVNQTPPVELPDLLTPGDLADLLHVSRQYLYSLRCRPGAGPSFIRLPSRRPIIRYRREDVLDWMTRNRSSGGEA